MSERQFDTTLPVRVNSELLEACHEKANANGKTLGAWVRSLLYRSVKLEEPPMVTRRQRRGERKA